MKQNETQNESYSKTELIIESVIVGIATGVGVLVLTTAFTILWAAGEGIWKTLIK